MRSFRETKEDGEVSVLNKLHKVEMNKEKK
jgi:hypothetical protein